MIAIKRQNFFFYSLILFVLSLSFSVALISITAGLTLLTAIGGNAGKVNKKYLTNRWPYLSLTIIYLIAVISLLNCTDIKLGLYDLSKALAFLIVPLAFFIALKLNQDQLIIVLKAFVVGVLASAAITIGRFYLSTNDILLDAQFAGFIHHIRFSLQVVMAIGILVYWQVYARNRNIAKLLCSVLAISFLLFFLAWQQSITGWITFFSLVILFMAYSAFRISNSAVKISIGVALCCLVFVPAYFVYTVHEDFYNVDQFAVEELPHYTSEGNAYTHNLDNPFTENGHYIGLYICEQELEEAWNNRSEMLYGSLDQNGNKVSDTLIRYLSSKGCTKDAAGVAKLSDEDVQFIENGVSNYKLAGRGFSFYPRVYVSIWEIDQYLKTGNANEKSLAQRIEYLRAAVSIWKQHKWFGVGTGNWKQAYRSAYQQMGSHMDESRYADAHNQYLAWLVRFGLLGTLVILACFILPIVYYRSWENPLFVLLLLIMLISNFADSNLDTHVGGYFMLLFYCLLVNDKTFRWSGMTTKEHALPK